VQGEPGAVRVAAYNLARRALDSFPDKKSAWQRKRRLLTHQELKPGDDSKKLQNYLLYRLGWRMKRGC
jgi:hypothetical protein